MSIKKRTTGAISAAADLGLGSPTAYALIRRIDVTASADTTVSLAITDENGDTVATIASSDYTTRTSFYIVPEEARVFDTAGEVAAANAELAPPVVARSPLTVTPSGLGSGTVTVDVYVEV
jgi:hypothetical protein